MLEQIHLLATVDGRGCKMQKVLLANENNGYSFFSDFIELKTYACFIPIANRPFEMFYIGLLSAIKHHCSK